MGINKKSAKNINDVETAALLYRISKAMATVKDGRELLKVIIEYAQPIFGFYDIGLCVLDKTGDFYLDWSVFYADINPSEANFEQRKLEKYIIPASEPLMIHVHERFAAKGKPFIERLTPDFAEKYADFIHLEVEMKHGFKQFLVTTLKFGGETLGILNFNSQKENHFEKCDTELFQAIADLVAVAVANITANEEILDRAREKDVLLSISQAIARIQNHEQLLKVIFERIQPVFGFHDVGLFILSKDGTLITDWAADLPAISPSPGNEQVKKQELETISFAESPLRFVSEELAKAESPRVFKYDDEYLNLISDTVIKAKVKIIIEESGYHEFLATPLKTGGKMLGLLFFNAKTSEFFDSEKFSIFQTVADQIGVAVANILANEEILEREREKTKLLSISREIAKVQNRPQLLEVIFTTIREIFPYDDAGLVYFCDANGKPNPKGEYYVHLLDDLISEVNTEIAEQNITGVLSEGIDGIRFHAGDQSSVTTLDQLIKGFPGHPFFPIMERDGIRQFISKGIKIGGETIGMLSFNSRRENFYSENDFPLFDNIANQVAVAVANILANEEILERVREKSVLLSISEDIASARNAVELLQVIHEKARQLIPFNDTGILILEEDGEYHYDLAVNLTGWDDSEANQKLNTLNLNRIVHPGSHIDFVMRLIETANSPVIENYKQRFHEFDQTHFIIMEELGYQQSIVSALKSGGKTFGTLWLNSLEKNHFKPEQFEVFQALADQVAVALSNILANDEIRRQLFEITDLKKRLEAENKYLTEEVRKNYNFEEIIGSSPRLFHIFEAIETVAPTDATILIQGETGTGKELIARAIHNRSTRKSRPLIKINCAALPRELVESELFGHERGAFTGATERRIGKFELAHQGTIFLDEIGELPLETQVKLLRVLQEKEIERVGGKGTIKLDLRVVAATNRNLAQEVQVGRFRADLYYRLCTVELFLPALRERKEDLEPLTLYFADKYAAKFSRRITKISPQMLAELHAYDFPGNVRELEHIVEHAVIFSRDEKLILPRSLVGNPLNSEIDSTVTDSKPPISLLEKTSASESQTLQSIEREHILSVLNKTSGRIKGKNGAAEILGLNPATVYFRLKKLGIERVRK